MSVTKILVFGDVCGKFSKFFKRLESINQKNGPFDIVLCVGDFFGNGEQNHELNKYKNKEKCLPLPIYILGPISLEQVKFYENLKNGEICHNLTFLGKRGLYTLSCGNFLRIAYLSGLDASTDIAENKSYCFTKDDVNAVKNSCLGAKNYNSDYRGIDILLTSQWPYGVDDDNSNNSSKLISFLCNEIRPRYHFCGLRKKYFEPPPFRVSKDNITQLSLSSRFVGLADFGNVEKQKYVFAVSLTPVYRMTITELISETTNEVLCPYKNINFSDCNLPESQPNQYFFEMVKHVRDERKRTNQEGNLVNKRSKFTPIDQDKCWFCLSSKDVEKHLVISIGARFYLALAKGPINDYHVLILSISHIQSSAHLTDDDWIELTKFKKALEKFFIDQGYAVCFTERNYKSSHLQINALGINAGYAWKIAHAFEDKAEEYNLEIIKLPKLTGPNMLPQGPYFVAELPDEQTLLTRQMKHFPLHFARDVFCCENLLNCDEKVDWKQCNLSKEQEIRMVESFREKFAKHDFTIN